MTSSTARRQTTLLTVALVGAAVMCGMASRATAQSINSPSAVKNAGNTADEGPTDGRILGVGSVFQRTSVAAIQAGATATTFTARYSATVDGDGEGIGQSRTENLTSDYTVSFNVTAPGAYFLTINTSILGDVNILTDGAGNATASVSNVTGTPTGGTLTSGNLNLTGGNLPVSSGSQGSGFNRAFNPTGTARIDATSNGSPVAHTLRFQWTNNCQSSAGGLSGGDECAIRLGIDANVASFTAGDYPGSPARATGATTDGHFVTVTLTSLCGNGTIDAAQGETCDEGVLNGTTGSCCASNCTLKTSGTVCRAEVAGGCDIQEVCTGASPTCPSDVVQPPGTVCRPAVPGGCDIQEVCNGSNTCPSDVVQMPGTICRPAVDECDLDETCNGTNTCPPIDSKKPNLTPCSSDSNPCTVDRCDGTNNACQHPAGNAGAVCRPSAGVCDVQEVCTGSSPTCPTDQFQLATVECRGVQGVCDLAENCTGSGALCPPDIKKTTECRAQNGVCDQAEVCDGVGNNCPTDGFKPNTQSCRAPAGVCDVEEFCSGTGPNCPDDAKSTEVCRPEAGFCDVEEVCDGFGDDCPNDQFKPSSVVCRTSVGVCDLTETCSGSAAACPPDVKSTSQCHVATDLCDQDDFCDGVVNDCPEGAKPSGSVCRSSGGVCDPAEVCNGVDITCPPDVKSVNVCRPAAGVCDVDEFCDGVNDNCPADTFKPSSVECRSSAGFCDVAENCTGSSAACPADAFKPSTTPCRAAVDQCDAAENCTGSAALCPADSPQPNGTACTDAGSPNPNTCLNACDTGVCTPGNPVTQSSCCGNGRIDSGETCDDGNQVDADGCPSAAGPTACKLVSGGALVRGAKKNPAGDRRSCQAEWYVVNPNNPLDRFHLPSNEQVCVDQDPTCDYDPRNGHCGFTVVVCLNNSDPSLPRCTPNGINSTEVIPPRPRLFKLPIINQLAAANTALLRDAVNALLDPNNPGAGYSNAPPIPAAKQDLCSLPIQLDVLSGAAIPNNPAVAAQLLKIKSRDGSLPRGKQNTSKLKLRCLARPLP